MNDEFDRAGAPDRQWDYEARACQQSCSTTNRRNARVGAAIVITARRAVVRCRIRRRVSSLGKFAFSTDWRFARIPAGRGTWPALVAGRKHADRRLAALRRIDLMENVG